MKHHHIFAFAAVISASMLMLSCTDDGSGGPSSTPINQGEQGSGQGSQDGQSGQGGGQQQSTCEQNTFSCNKKYIMLCSSGKLIPAEKLACQFGTFYSCETGELTQRACVKCVVSNNYAQCMDCKGDEDCTGTEKCINGVCQVPSGCGTDTCVLDQRECDGTDKWRLCQDVKGDGCPTWSPSMPCDEGTVCLNGLCRNADETCDDECSAYSKECVSDGYRTCTPDDMGCLKWSGIIPCSSDEACMSGTCKKLGSGCNDECVIEDTITCDGNGWKKCIRSDEGCLVWSNITACKETERCKDGICETRNDDEECTSECTSGSIQCSDAGGYIECKDTNGDGCVEWSTEMPCPNSMTCTGNKCQSAIIDDPVAANNEPVRYPGDSIHSPINDYVVQNMKGIASRGSGMNNGHFMKLGDSQMANSSLFLRCFSSQNSAKVTLDSHTGLSDVITAFQSAGLDSFNRDSLTAEVGKRADYPLEAYNGSKRITQEISATTPRFAFFGFGGNDMINNGYNKSKYGNAFQTYYQYILQNMEILIPQGIIPLFIGIGPHDPADFTGADKDNSKHYVTTANLVSRGVAEAYQVPFMNLQKVLSAIPGNGLNPDGIHLNAASSACDLTSNGLSYGMNTRNLYSMEMLDRAWRVVAKGEKASDNSAENFKGTGSQSDPFVITSLPYTHSSDTSKSTNVISKYNCGDQSEIGPEFYYKLTVNSRTRIRAFSLSATKSIDVDIHLLKDTIDANNCIIRNDKMIEAILDPGTYYFVVDTYNKASNAGKYLFGVHECDEDDASCGTP